MPALVSIDHAIVNDMKTPLITAVLLLIALNSLFSQVFRIEKSYEHFIEVPDDSIEKILSHSRVNVFIFTEKESKDKRAQNLVRKLELLELNSEIDIEHFNVFLISVFRDSTIKVCKLSGSVELSGYSNLTGTFIYSPHYILVDDNPLYQSLKKERLETAKVKPSRIFDKTGVSYAPFEYFEDENDLISLITRPTEADSCCGMVASLSEEMAGKDSLLKEYQKKIPMAGSGEPKTSENPPSKAAKLIGISFTPNFLAFQKASGMSNEYFSSSSRQSSFHLLYRNYPIGKNSRLGYAIGIGMRRSSTDISLSDEGMVLVDTLNGPNLDADGEDYTRIAYGEGLEESVVIRMLGFSLQASYLIPIPSNNKDKSRANLALGAGLKLWGVRKGVFQSQAGTISYGGLYSQYPGDTLFSGLYDFYQNRDIEGGEQELSTKGSVLNPFFSVDFGIFPFLDAEGPISKLQLSFGLSFESRKNLLSDQEVNNLLPAQPDQYSSLLYREGSYLLGGVEGGIGLLYRF